MENSLLTTFVALLLFGVREIIAQSKNASLENNTLHAPCIPIPTTPSTTCQNFTEYIPQPPILARVKILWKMGSQCDGQLVLSTHEEQEVPVCFDSYSPRTWLQELCKDKRCGDYTKSERMSNVSGYVIYSNETLSKTSCIGRHITCQDDLGKELAAYKAVTAILLLFIFSVILLQFGRPTYKAIRKRFSQKRQNRWIGPTQTQSVSYHRGQAGGHLDNNTVKRQSYPGLEKLSVNASREPSSNRNSDYDSYGFN
nr:T-cell surface glycoprotein CD5 [Misgurnus anguillicaudatus]